MKLSDIKDKIDAYFDKTPVEEIIKGFEELGYEFVPINDSRNTNEYTQISSINSVALDLTEISIFNTLEKIGDDFSSIDKLDNGRLPIIPRIPYQEDIDSVIISVTDVELTRSKDEVQNSNLILEVDRVLEIQNSILRKTDHKQHAMAA